MLRFIELQQYAGRVFSIIWPSGRVIQWNTETDVLQISQRINRIFHSTISFGLTRFGRANETVNNREQPLSTPFVPIACDIRIARTAVGLFHACTEDARTKYTALALCFTHIQCPCSEIQCVCVCLDVYVCV